MAIIEYSNFFQLIDLFIEKKLNNTTSNLKENKINEIIDFILKNKINQNINKYTPVNEYWQFHNNNEKICNDILNNLHKFIYQQNSFDENFQNLSCIEVLNVNALNN